MTYNVFGGTLNIAQLKVKCPREPQPNRRRPPAFVDCGDISRPIRPTAYASSPGVASSKLSCNQ